MLPRVFAGLLIDWDSAGGLPLGLQHRIGPRLNALPQNIHVARLHVPEVLVNIGQREGRGQQRRRLGRGKVQGLHLHQNVLPHGILIGVVQHFLRGLAQQPVLKPFLLRCHFVI